MFTATSMQSYAGIGTDDIGSDDVHHIDGPPSIHLLVGLADEAVRRIARRQADRDALAHGPSHEDVERLCEALMSSCDHAEATKIMDALARTKSREVIYLQYLAAAARLLGDWWTEDRVSFTEVTAATGRIFELLRAMSVPPRPETDPRDVTVIFASVPGEKHTLGIRMAADLFRGDGWEIVLRVGLSEDELVGEIARQSRCIVGLSVGGRHSLDELSSLVEALHRHCPRAVIVVSGQDIAEIRPCLTALGVDGVADGIDEAREQISALWDREMARQEAVSPVPISAGARRSGRS